MEPFRIETTDTFVQALRIAQEHSSPMGFRTQEGQEYCTTCVDASGAYFLSVLTDPTPDGWDLITTLFPVETTTQKCADCHNPLHKVDGKIFQDLLHYDAVHGEYTGFTYSVTHDDMNLVEHRGLLDDGKIHSFAYTAQSDLSDATEILSCEQVYRVAEEDAKEKYDDILSDYWVDHPVEDCDCVIVDTL